MLTGDWGNYEENLLIAKFDGQWSLDEQIASFDKLFALARRKSHNIVLMIDMQRAQKTPRGFLHAFYQYAKMHPTNLAAIIIISPSPVWEKRWQAATHIYDPIPDINLAFPNNTDNAYKLAVAYLMIANSKHS